MKGSDFLHAPNCVQQVTSPKGNGACTESLGASNTISLDGLEMFYQAAAAVQTIRHQHKEKQKCIGKDDY